MYSVWNDSSESLRFTIYSFITLCNVDGLIKYCIHEGFAFLMDKISISIRNRKTQNLVAGMVNIWPTNFCSACGHSTS